jgi:hypothetical protein
MAAAHSPLAEAESAASAFYYLMELQRVSNDLSQRAYDPRLVFMVAFYVHRLRAAIALVSAGSHPEGVSVAVDELKRAVQVQDAMGYDEPRTFYESSRPVLALALAARVAHEEGPAQQLQSGSAAMSSPSLDALAPALSVVREDLRRLPANPQALHVCARLGVPGCTTGTVNIPATKVEHATPTRTNISSAQSTPCSLIAEHATADVDRRRRIPLVDAGARAATLVIGVCVAVALLLLKLPAMVAAIRRKCVAKQGVSAARATSLV